MVFLLFYSDGAKAGALVKVEVFDVAGTWFTREGQSFLAVVQ
jgi:hypothetical protein